VLLIKSIKSSVDMIDLESRTIGAIGMLARPPDVHPRAQLSHK
jgi:hypothetical protein